MERFVVVGGAGCSESGVAYDAISIIAAYLLSRVGGTTGSAAETDVAWGK